MIIFRNKATLAANLIFSIFGLYFILAMGFTISQLYLEFREEGNRILKEMDNIEKISFKNLVNSIWNLNAKAIDDNLKGMISSPSVIYVELFDEYGKLINTKGKNPNANSSVKWIDQSISKSYNLVKKDGVEGGRPELGKIVLYSSNQIIFERLKYGLVLTFINAFLKSLILWLIMLFFIKKHLSVPLRELTYKIEDLDYNNLDKLDFKYNLKNEISKLKNSFNTMIAKLIVAKYKMNKTLDDLDQKNKELEDYKEQLEDMVNERTNELGQSIVLLKNEIEKHKITEEKLQIAREKAEKASEVKSQFVANVSHEIRTPMNAIIGFTELLGKYIVDSKGHNYLKAIRKSGMSLVTLIDDILDLAKVEAGKLEVIKSSFSIQELLQEIELIFSFDVEKKGIQLIVERDPKLPEFISLDETRIRQIIYNLVSNAIKFTDEGHVLIRSYPQNISEKNKRFDLIIEIEDTGIGIPDSQKEKIFGNFEQTDGQDANMGGTGLGLSIIKGLLGIMKGKVEILNRDGGGSVFQVTIPDTEFGDSKDSVAEKEVPIDGIDFKGSKVLIVDDTPIVLKLLTSYLEKYKLELLTAENGKEAIEKALNEKPDLILMDIVMTEMDGIEATEKIKEKLDVPVIAISATELTKDSPHLKNLFEGAVSKEMTRKFIVNQLIKILPYDREELVQKVIQEDTPFRKATPKLGGTDIKTEGIELLEVMEELQLISEWKTLCKRPIFSKIFTFSSKVEDLAGEYSIPELVKWSQDLKEAADSYNSNKVKRCLSSFMDVIKKIELEIDKENEDGNK